jgi:hypothetical protein
MKMNASQQDIVHPNDELQEDEKQEEIEAVIHRDEVGDLQELEDIDPNILLMTNMEVDDPEDPHIRNPDNENEICGNDNNIDATPTIENVKEGPKYVDADAPFRERLWEVFVTFWPLGLVAFGGPTATVALLRQHLVVQRKWVDEETFLEASTKRESERSFACQNVMY